MKILYKQIYSHHFHHESIPTIWYYTIYTILNAITTREGIIYSSPHGIWEFFRIDLYTNSNHPQKSRCEITPTYFRGGDISPQLCTLPETNIATILMVFTRKDWIFMGELLVSGRVAFIYFKAISSGPVPYPSPSYGAKSCSTWWWWRLIWPGAVEGSSTV